jgi:addiction module HigA family antidote
MLNNYHPGLFLQELLRQYNISAYRLSKDIHLPQTRISQILRGKRAISIDTASRLAKYFGISINYWLNLQNSYDITNSNLDICNKIEQLKLI